MGAARIPFDVVAAVILLFRRQDCTRRFGRGLIHSLLLLSNVLLIAFDSAQVAARRVKKYSPY
jgi:hypothetical protein